MNQALPCISLTACSGFFSLYTLFRESFGFSLVSSQSARLNFDSTMLVMLLLFRVLEASSWLNSLSRNLFHSVEYCCIIHFGKGSAVFSTPFNEMICLSGYTTILMRGRYHDKLGGVPVKASISLTFLLTLTSQILGTANSMITSSMSSLLTFLHVGVCLSIRGCPLLTRKNVRLEGIVFWENSVTPLLILMMVSPLKPKCFVNGKEFVFKNFFIPFCGTEFGRRGGMGCGNKFMKC